MVNSPTTAGPGATRPGLHQITVLALTETVPAWAIKLDEDNLLGSVLATEVDGRTTVVLVDSCLLDSHDAAWVHEIEATLGTVIIVCANEADGQRVRAHSTRAAVPSSLLAAPESVALQVLSDLIVAPRTSNEKMERYMRDAIHEFRTPLTVISEFAGLCEDGIGGPLTERQEVYIRYIQSAVGRLGEHFDDFRDGVRMRLGSLTHGRSRDALRPVVEGAVQAMGARAVGLDAINPCRLNQVDAERLGEAIKRMIGGAQKLGAKGETVEVSVRPVGARAEIRVAYQGVVLSQDDIAVMACGTVMRDDGFYRSVARVFGLGISMARLFIAQSGGDMRLEIQEDVGGTFVASIPMQHAVVPELIAADPAAEAA